MKRAIQHALGTTRALGLTECIREDGSEDGESEGSLDDVLNSLVDELDEAELEALEAGDVPVTSLRDPTTGQSLTKHGTALDLIQAGFVPQRLPLLYDKLKMIVTDVIESVSRQRYHLGNTISVFQIYRNPNRLPWDVQKVLFTATCPACMLILQTGHCHRA